MPSPVDRDCGYLFSSNMMDPPAIAWSSLAKGSPRFLLKHFSSFLSPSGSTGCNRTIAGCVWGFDLDFWDFRELSIHKSCHKLRSSTYRPARRAGTERGNKKSEIKTIIGDFFSPLDFVALCGLLRSQVALSLPLSPSHSLNE